MAALQLGSPHTSPHPFHDQAAFQLSDDGDDDDEGAAHGAPGIELFAKADELYVQATELVEHFQEMPY